MTLEEHDAKYGQRKASEERDDIIRALKVIAIFTVIDGFLIWLLFWWLENANKYSPSLHPVQQPPTSLLALPFTG